MAAAAEGGLRRLGGLGQPELGWGVMGGGLMGSGGGLGRSDGGLGGGLGGGFGGEFGGLCGLGGDADAPWDPATNPSSTGRARKRRQHARHEHEGVQTDVEQGVAARGERGAAGWGRATRRVARRPRGCARAAQGQEWEGAAPRLACSTRCTAAEEGDLHTKSGA